MGDEIALEVAADTEHVEIREGSVAHLRHTGHVDLLASIQLDPERGFPLDVGADIHSLNLGALMDQLGVTRNSIVNWPMSGRGELRGTLSPLAIEGPLNIRNEGFMVTIDPWHQRNGRRLMGVERGTIRGTWRFDEEAAKFLNMHVDTGLSQVDVPLVHLGFDNRVRVEGSSTNINLADVSPFTTFDMAGVGSANVVVTGTFWDPQVRGSTKMRDFAFDTFPHGRRRNRLLHAQRLSRGGVSQRPRREEHQSVSYRRLDARLQGRAHRSHRPSPSEPDDIGGRLSRLSL